MESVGRRSPTSSAGGGRLLAAGNGGSAAEAQHLTAELVGRFRRRPAAAVAPSPVRRDVEPDGDRQRLRRRAGVRPTGRGARSPGDVLVLLSTSGRSANVAGRGQGGPRGGPGGVGDDRARRRTRSPASPTRRSSVDAPSPPRRAGGRTSSPCTWCAPPWTRRSRCRAVPELAERWREPCGWSSSATRCSTATSSGAAERVAPDAPSPSSTAGPTRRRPGGAGLAAACSPRAAGGEVTLVTALGTRRRRGARLRELLAGPGRCARARATPARPGCKLRIRAGGPAVAAARRPRRRPRPGALPAAPRAAVDAADAVLVADYGRGVTAHPGVRAALPGARRAAGGVGPAPARRRPGAGRAARHARTAAEAAAVRGAAPAAGDLTAAAGAAARALAGAGGACATTGRAGRAAVLARASAAAGLPAPPLPRGDPCGAGDRSPRAAALALAARRAAVEAVAGGGARASSCVAAGGAAAPCAVGRRRPVPPLRRRRSPTAAVARGARGGGTVVATGGCFDLLHAGHVGDAAGGPRARRLPRRAASTPTRRCAGSRAPAARSCPRPTAPGCCAALAASTPSSCSTRTTPDARARAAAPARLGEGRRLRRRRLPEADASPLGRRRRARPYLAGRSTTSSSSPVLRGELAVEPSAVDAVEGRPRTGPCRHRRRLRPGRRRRARRGRRPAARRSCWTAGAPPDARPRARSTSPTPPARAAAVGSGDRVGGLGGVVTAAGIDACGTLDDVDGGDVGRG